MTLILSQPITLYTHTLINLLNGLEAELHNVPLHSLMDLLTHTLSGVVAGTLVASFSRKGLKHKLLIIGAGGFAGALPDIDAISLWSGFDVTFGRFFNLSHTGREIYSEKFWYSHHGFMHSIFAALLISILSGFWGYGFSQRWRKMKLSGLLTRFKQRRLIHFAFILGFIIHLVEDMPTPSSAWGGVNLFWPSNTYIGGFGRIWWWNNYDIFLIVCSVLILNLALLCIPALRQKLKRLCMISVFSIGFTFALIQINTRPVDFAYKGSTSRYNEFEEKSKEIQKEILGTKLYNMMESFDNKLRIYF